MIEKHRGFNILTEENDNEFTVTIVNKKNYKGLFDYTFTVYANYDQLGLIDDTIDIYKRQLK